MSGLQWCFTGERWLSKADGERIRATIPTVLLDGFLEGIGEGTA